jgi:small subunit ribosomal protein S7
MMIPPPEDPLLHYFTSHIMHHGERNKAARITTNMLAQIHRLTEAPPLPILRHAIFLASPSVRIKSHKKSAKSLMVPMPLTDRQRTFFAIKWLLQASKSRSDRKLEDRLAKEVIRIIEGESDVLKKKMEVHKLAVANRCVPFRRV